MNTTERQIKIDEFGKGYERFSSVIKSLSDEEMHFRPGPGRWSAHDMIIHVADSEASGYIRLRRALSEPGSSVMPWDQDVWAQKLDYQSQDPALHLELFRLLRQSSYEIVKKIPDEKWNNTYEHPEYGTVTLDGWLDIYSKHIQSHIAQINRNLEAMKAK
jgi:hypothetical protein